MNAPLSRIEQIRGRDGDACWLCKYPLDFAATKNSARSPTIEHIEAKANGGSDGLANLALCHKACNAHLRDHPKAKKLAIRAKWHAEYDNRRSMRAQPRVRPVAPRDAPAAIGRWQIIAAASALVAAFASGLATGLLLAA